MVTHESLEKLEEIFDLDTTPESMNETLDAEQKDKDDKEADQLIKTKIGLDKIDSALPEVVGLEDDKEIDNDNLLKGLNLVGDYMSKNILKPNNINYPNARSEFINLFK